MKSSFYKVIKFITSVAKHVFITLYKSMGNQLIFFTPHLIIHGCLHIFNIHILYLISKYASLMRLRQFSLIDFKWKTKKLPV